MIASRINIAVSECLKECYKSNSPLITVAEFVAKLESDPAWDKDDIEAVKSAVLKILTALMDKG